MGLTVVDEEEECKREGYIGYFEKISRGTIRVAVCHVGGSTGTADSDKVRVRGARCQRWP